MDLFLHGSITCFLYANSRSSITSSSVYKHVVLFLSAAAILLVSGCGNTLINWYLDAFNYLLYCFHCFYFWRPFVKTGTFLFPSSFKASLQHFKIFWKFIYFFYRFSIKLLSSAFWIKNSLMKTLRGALSLMLKTKNANLMALLQESQEECPLGTNVCKKNKYI